jgi:hypothetical protein
MKSSSAFIVIAAAILALPALARDADPSREWKGYLIENGERAPLDVVALSEGGEWTGTFELTRKHDAEELDEGYVRNPPG